jgi:hypothetical protein
VRRQSLAAGPCTGLSAWGAESDQNWLAWVRFGADFRVGRRQLTGNGTI